MHTKKLPRQIILLPSLSHIMASNTTFNNEAVHCLMNLLDQHSEDVNESQYMNMCNALKHLHMNDGTETCNLRQQLHMSQLEISDQNQELEEQDQQLKEQYQRLQKQEQQIHEQNQRLQKQKEQLREYDQMNQPIVETLPIIPDLQREQMKEQRVGEEKDQQRKQSIEHHLAKLEHCQAKLRHLKVPPNSVGRNHKTLISKCNVLGITISQPVQKASSTSVQILKQLVKDKGVDDAEMKKLYLQDRHKEFNADKAKLYDLIQQHKDKLLILQKQ